MKRILLIPPRIVAWLSGNHARPLKMILMVLVLITALYTKEYKGQHQHIINSNIGGILYVMFGSLLLSAIFPRLKFYGAVLIAFGATCILEFVQYFQWPFMAELTKHKAMAYLFGTSFNPRDFLYYAAGAAISLALLLALEHKNK